MRNVLITGGTRGIGKALAIVFRDAGYRVAVTYHSQEAIARDFTQETGIPSFPWDVANHEACQEGVAAVTHQIGPIDTLVNNAGITQDAIFHKMTWDQWKTVLQTNLDSVFNMCRAVIEPMRERQFGRIITVSSINGQKGQVGQTNYSAAKAGILGFTKALAQEVAPKGITVNALAPGYVATAMTQAVPASVLEKIVAQIPVGRLGTPEEIAQVALFLASEAASFVTGATLSINGGQYLL
ncbi:MAG: acetoacetyl-CoA reductase [Holosporales bacterium]|jgi:acetoacetyl-CoA reductase|nr:acetoacetyl-CoA reductase [Holosporales bacterium]